MSKNIFLRVPDPFDSSTNARLERLGILRPDGDDLIALVDKVHLADEAGHMTGLRLVVDLGRRADLLELALLVFRSMIAAVLCFILFIKSVLWW